MATFKLDDIRAAAEAKYGSTEIETSKGVVTLLNPLRLPKERRDELMSIQDKLSADDVDQETVLADAIRTVAKTPAQAEKLLDQVGGDLTVLIEIFNSYTSGTQVGEASASQS